jgi:polysaccharide export outer membrane protein
MLSHHLRNLRSCTPSSIGASAFLRIAVLGAFALLLLPGAGCAPKNRPENVAEAEMDIELPPTGGFTFGAGDTLKVTVWRHEDLTMELTVAPDGAISFPLVGRLQIAGMTYDEVVKVMQEGIGKYYVDAQVAVNILAVTNQKVLILGEVPNPMVLQITNDLSILEAIVRAGGISQDAHTSNVLLIRGGLEKPKLYTVNVDAIFREGDMQQMVYLQRGDIVVVPPKTITNVQRFFQRISSIIGPAVSGSTIYRNVLYGTSVGSGN